MDVSVITVTWNSAQHIAQQIDSVKRAFVGRKYQHIIIDNNSTDATAKIIATQFPEVTLVKNNVNVGFAAANNQALRLATGKYFLFLNPDMVVSAESLVAMEKYLDSNNRVAIAGCRLVNERGENRLSLRPTFFPTFSQLLALIFKLPVFYPKLSSRWCYPVNMQSEPVQVDAVRGSCLMMRRVLFEQLGFAFDPQFFIWFEDVDICREAKRLGWQVVYLPYVQAIDFMGQSFKQIDHVKRQQQFLKSAVLYFKKWHSPYQAKILLLLSPLSVFVVWVYAVLQGNKIFKFRDAIER